MQVLAQGPFKSIQKSRLSVSLPNLDLNFTVSGIIFAVRREAVSQKSLPEIDLLRNLTGDVFSVTLNSKMLFGLIFCK